MKALLTRTPHFILRLLAAVFVMIGCIAALVSTASVASPGHTGQALALRAMLHPASAPRGFQAQRASGLGHFVSNPKAAPKAMRAFATGSTSSSVLISESVQTYDVFAGPPAFQPGDGPLTPTNLTPIWTSDDSELIFSSNRPYTTPSGATNVSDGTFHLWSISSKGDQPSASTLHQITTSSGNEFFPALTTDNSRLAFVSTAGNGTQNLYVVSNFSATQTSVNVGTLTSLTIRTDINTGFGEVDRPTWDPSGQRLAFSARDTGGTYAGRRHIWFLYTNSGGAFSAARPTIDNPPGKLTNGPGDDTDPAWSPGATNFIAFASTASAIANSTQAPALTSAPAAAPTRSLFVISGGGTNGMQLTNVNFNTGTDDFAPAWNSSTNYAGELAFSRGASPSALHDIYYFQAVISNNGAVTLQNGDFAQQYNTDDNGGVSGNQYDDIYPSWSNVQTAVSIAYASNRSVTYNDPTTGNPVETAISLPQAALVAGVPAQGKVGPNYAGLLVSLFDDVDPPTLLPYNSSEVIHVTDGTNNPTNPALLPRRNGDIIPGHTVTFTVRLSNRESGVDDNNVYLQIKDPDSKYQDAQGLEHKVFTKDATDYIRTPDTYANQDAFVGTTGGGQGSVIVGSATAYLYNGQDLNFSDDPFNPEGVDASPTTESYEVYGNPIQRTTVNKVNYDAELRGAVGGMDGGTPLVVGYLDPNNPGVNPVTEPDKETPPQQQPLPGGDPANYRVWGQEYECQFVNPQFNGFSGTNDTDPTPANLSEYYGTPFYLAGVDDQQPHSVYLHPPRPTANTNADPTTTPPTPAQPAEWLQMTRVANQDTSGGVLYSVTWTTPASASDFYLDVIAYDKADFTGDNFPDQNTGAGTPSDGANFRIYDNIWGFSTQPFSGGNNILVVSDNALGQKFVGSTSFANIPPIYYGAESYYTDVDINLLPNTIYRSVAGAKGSQRNGQAITPDGVPVAQLFPISPTSEANLIEGFINGQFQFRSLPVLNGLGVNSYNDGSAAVTTVDGVSVTASQQYNIWRILSRGTIPPDVLDSYEPRIVTQPAVNDPQTGFTAPGGNVSDARKCVIWVSPYTGDLPLNVSGSLADTNTQQELRDFVTAGGRLFVSGGHVASALSLGGAVPSLNGPGSFLYDVLNASLVPNDGGSQALSAGGGIGSRISGDAYFNANTGVPQVQNFYTTVTANNETYATPNSLPLLLGNDYERFFNPGGGNPPHFNLWRSDGSLDQLGPVQTSFGPQFVNSGNLANSQIDVITPQNNAVTDISIAGPGYAINTHATGPALIYKDGIGANGGRVVFASFGLEGMGIEYYKLTVNNADSFYPRNQRPNILHNIVTYLRTGTVIGKITAGSSGGQNLAGATVYLLPNTGALPASDPTTYSATTGTDGTYRIDGVDPGGYNVVAYRTGYTRTAANGPYIVTADGTVGVNLNLLPVPPGAISGKVTDATNGNVGLGNATVTFTSTDGLSTASGITNPDGTYTITNVQAGTYNGTATKSGYTTGAIVTPVSVQSSATTTGINFALSVVPGTVGGLVQDDSNPQIPVAGATITISDKPLSNPTAKIIQTVQTTTPSTSPAATPDPTTGSVTGDGNPLNYTASLAQGTYYITVTPPPTGYVQTPVSQGPFTVTSQAFTRIPTVTLTSTQGTVGGLVTDVSTGQPLGGATVTISENGTVLDILQTNAGGATTTSTGETGDGQPVNYSQALTNASDYTITVTAPNRLTQTFTNVSVTAHHFTRQNAALVSTLGTLGGLVTDSVSHQALNAATVTITDANGTPIAGSPFTTTSDTTTNYGPITLPATDASGQPITYKVSASFVGSGTTAKPDYPQSPPISVTLVAGQFKSQPIALAFGYGTLGGLVTDATTGQPLAGATITVIDSTGNTVATINSRSTQTSPPAPTGNGQPQNYNVRLYQGTYTLSISATNYATLSGIVVNVNGSAFTSQNFALSTTLGTLGGLVSDSFTNQPVGGVAVTVSDKPLTDPTEKTFAHFTTSATTTPAPDGGAQNYGGMLTQGIYVVTLSRNGYVIPAAQTVTVTAGQFVRLDFTGTNGLSPIHVFGAGYLFFSTPYDYASLGVGFDQLFGPLNTGTFNPFAPNPSNANRSQVFVWNPQTLSYTAEPSAPADGLHLGQGYWVYEHSPHEVNVAGTAPTGTVSVSLHKGWNQIGVPSLTPINVSNLTFTNPANGASITFAQATSSTYHLISSPLYSYNGTSYDSLVAGGALQPWQAYWIFAFNDITVQIPTK